jgi:hypothetical protein
MPRPPLHRLVALAALGTVSLSGCSEPEPDAGFASLAGETLMSRNN